MEEELKQQIEVLIDERDEWKELAKKYEEALEEAKYYIQEALK